MKQLAIFLIMAIQVNAQQRTIDSSGIALEQSHFPVRFNEAKEWVIVQPKENFVGVRNPMKGWRGQIAMNYGWGTKVVDSIGTQPVGTELESLRKWYVSWNQVETCESDGIEKLQLQTDRILADFPAHNMKAIPRIALLSIRGSEIPTDLPPLTNYRACDWYLLPQVRQRIERLIARAGAVWDHDPRIAYVEMGIVSKYGEQWDLGKFPEIEHYLHVAYSKAFKNKPILIRGAGFLPWTPSLELAKAAPYGFFEDSYGVPMYERETLGMGEIDGGKRWEVSPLGGESKLLEYDDGLPHQKNGWNDYILPSTKTGKVKVPSIFESAGRLDYFQYLIHQSHTNFLGSAEGCELVGQSPEIIASVHNSLGYRFVLSEARFPNCVEPLDTLAFRFKVKNTGSSPIYGHWKLAIYLADYTTHQPVWTGILDGVDPREWLPGNRYDTTLKGYTNQAKTYTINQMVKLPKNLAHRDYVVAIAILDEEGGDLPTVRFAIENYWQGGLHPLGIIGVGQKPKAKLDSATFFRNGVDSTLHYVVKKEVNLK